MSNKSKAIKTISYDSTRKDLTIKFKSEKQYVYTPVSEDLVNRMSESSSKGKFFNENIKDNPMITCMKVV